MSGLIARFRRVLSRLLPLALVWATTLVAVGLLSSGFSVPGSAAALAVVTLTWFQHRLQRGDPHLVPRAAVVGCLAAHVPDPWISASSTALIAVLLVEPWFRSVVQPPLIARNVPELRIRRSTSPFFDVSCVLAVALALTVLGVLSTPGFAALTAVLLGFACVRAAVQLARWRQAVVPKAIQAALNAYRPKFIVYYSGTALAAYQIRMWLPYLERIQQRYVLVVRQSSLLDMAETMTQAPVVFARSVESLERVMGPTIGAVFYVNNDLKNANGVRFRGMRHVHLGHGDSDKPASYNATTAMFDLIFVSGEAAIDRYAAHGVLIPREKFRVVGRPQAEALHVRPDQHPVPVRPAVLYAPTWRGGLADMGFGSLRFGPRIVLALLQMGTRVVFRPHPYSSRDAESRVLIGKIDGMLCAHPAGDHVTSAEAAKSSVSDCMNDSDALVTDVSSLASDYLYTRKPFAMTDMGVTQGALAQSYPIARAAYILDHRVDPTPTLQLMLSDDVLAGTRDTLREYYVGASTGQELAQAFVRAAQEAIGPDP